MADIYLCIGTMKTGTTAIQYFLASNRKKLQEQGICYPYLKIPGKKLNNRNGHFLIYCADGETEEERQEKEKKVKMKAMDCLREAAEQYDKIILSEELIWHHSKKFENFWLNTKKDMESIGCNLKVVVYLRRQDEVIESLWKQQVKHLAKWKIPFDDFVNEERYRYFVCDYYKRLNQIARVIGKENIIVRPYEYGQFKGETGDVVSDFADTLKIQMVDEFVQPQKRQHVRLEGNYLEIKRCINEVEAYREMDDFMEQFINKLVEEENRPVETSSMFSYEERVRFVEKFEKDNNKLAQSYLGQEKLFLKPVKNVPKFVPDQQTLIQDVIHVFTQEMCLQRQKMKKLEDRVKGLEKLQRLSVKQRLYNKCKRTLGKIE